MSKREKLSGCQYRLLAKSKAAKQEELISKTKKLDTFFFQKSENKQSQINNDLDKQSENNSDSILNVSQFSSTGKRNTFLFVNLFTNKLKYSNLFWYKIIKLC